MILLLCLVVARALAKDPSTCSAHIGSQCCTSWTAGVACEVFGTAIAAAASAMTQPCGAGSHNQTCGYSNATRLPSPAPGASFALSLTHASRFPSSPSPAGANKLRTDSIYLLFASTTGSSCAVQGRSTSSELVGDGGRAYCDLHNLGRATGVNYGEAVDPLNCADKASGLCELA